MNKTLGTEGEDFVIAMDTDSVYITMDKLVQKVLPEETDKGKIIEFLNKSEGMFEKVLLMDSMILQNTQMHSRTKWKWVVRLLQTEVFGLQRNGTY